MPSFLTLLVIFISLLRFSIQDISDNEVDGDKFNAFAEVAGSLLPNKGDVGDLGSVISSFMTSEGGKQIGDMLLNSGAGANMLQGLAGMITNADGGGGMDFEMMANVVSAIGAISGSASGGSKKDGDGFDFSSAINLANSFIGQTGAQDFMAYLPTIMNLFNSVMGPDSEKTAKEHAGHSWMLPPIIERFHILIDQLMNSDLGKDLTQKVGAEKFARIFEDAHGRFSYRKFIEMMENHSFRKHWIQMFTSRIADVLTYVADPTIATVQFFLNNVLKGYGIPKHALFDPTRPGETLAALINYVSKRYLGIKFNSAGYVLPAVAYVQELVKLAENKGFLGRSWNKHELTHKLTDTVNLEIIEPLARVNRAVRFAKKVPNCTRYVLCLANQHEPEEMLSLPGLKKMLANGATFAATWLLSGYDPAPFWQLYGMVQEGKQCTTYFNEQCQDFHIEEEKVTTEYVHNEL